MIFGSIRKQSMAIAKSFAIGSIRLLAIAFAFTASAAIETAPNWAESEPPIRFKSRDWADAVLAAASTNSSIAIEGGRLLSNANWDSSKTHLIFNTVYVPSGVTLTISEGAVVKFCPDTTIKVEDGGKLSIVGASGNDVILTAANDATAGEIVEGLGEEAITFGGIRLQSSAATFTDNCHLETRGFNYGSFPTVTVLGTEAVRNGGVAYVPFTLSGSSRETAFSVEWEAIEGTAKFGEDYTLASGTISWGKSSEGTKTLQIPLNAANVTGEERTFTVRIKAARGSNIGTRTATVKIVERDALTLEWAGDWAESEPPIRFKSRDWADAVLAAASTNDAIAIEGGRLLSNTTWDSIKTHLVFNTVYVPSGVTLTISAGAVVKFCPGTMIKVEDGGKLSIVGASGNDVILMAANDATIGEVIAGFTPEQSMAFGGIRLQSTAATFTDNGWLETRGFNYGAYPSVTLNDSTAFRSSGLASIPVTISGSRDQELTVDWVAVDDTAKYGEDYTLASGRITWSKASEGTKTISIPLVTTNIVGAITSFKIKIVTARGANIADGECTVSIREFDTLNIESASAESTLPIRFKSRDWADAVLAAASTNDAIAVEGGRLLANTTWNSTKTHLVFNTVYVPSGVTLTISAGAIVKFCPGTMIKVEDGGKLNIVGASGNDVILTAANDATAGEIVEGLGEEAIAFDGIRLQSTAATFTDNGWLETRGFDYSAYPSVTLHDATANRKLGMVYLPVTVGGTTRNQSFTVDWVAEEGSAQFGRDYMTQNSGRLTWSKSEDGTKYITIPLVTTENAGTNRTFTVRFVVARGVNVSRGEATVTIAEFAFDGLNGQPVEITTNAVSSTEFTIKEGIGSQPIFLNDVEQVRYSGKWQTYDENEAAALRVTVDSDNGTKVLKECSVEETGSFELRQSDYATGFYTLKHEILNNLGETLATMKKSFSIIDTEDVELHGGILTQSETWSADKVHVVYETVTVPAAYTLFIEPGAIVKFMTGTGIDISQGGALFANKIVFTHINDDTIGGDTLSDGYTVAPPMDAYELKGNFTFGDDTELRNITQNTALAGTISTRKVLSRGSTYRVSGTVTIANGGSLTIPPGTVLKMESGASIVVNSGATFTAVGTRAAPIIITSIKDDSVSGDTNGDGDKTIPQPGDWRGVIVNGYGRMVYCVAQYAAPNNETGIVETKGSGVLSIDSSIIAHAKYDGIWNWGGEISATNTVVVDTGWATAPYRGSKNEYVNCIFYGNNVGLCYWSHWSGKPSYINCIFAECGYGWCETGSNQYADPPSTVVVQNSLFWNPDGFEMQSSSCVGESGNIWGDPLFVDPDNGDFRIQEGSPCVDAADSSVAPEFDYYGQPRITVTEQGTNTIGQLADIGICEVMPRNVTSDIDLVPQNVRTETNAVPGELLFVKWEVKNAGGRELEGAWRDTVSLVSNNGREVVLGNKTTMGVIAPGGSIFCSGYFTIPPISEGEWYPKVNVNSYRDVFEGALGVNNALVGDRVLTVMAEAFDPSVAREGVIGGGTPSVIKLTFGADDENRMVKFDLPAGVKVTWGFGFMPQGASQSGAMTATDGGVMFRVPDGATDVYVVLESDKTATYEMTTESTKMVITGVTPNTLPSSGTTTLVITGAGFGETNEVIWASTTDSVRLQSTAKDASGNLIATVDCAQLKAGQVYDVKVTSGNKAAELARAVTISKVEGKGVLEARLILPETARQGRVGVGYIEYSNVGTGDMPVPIFIISNEIINEEDVVFSLSSSFDITSSSLRIVGIGSVYPKGILRRNDLLRIPFYYKVNGAKYDVNLSIVDDNSDLLRESVYPKWKDFCVGISDAATRVNGTDGNISDYEVIYANAMRKAYGRCVGVVSGRLVDAVSDEPMAGERVYIADTNLTVWAKAITDTDGKFRFTDLQYGITYHIGAYTCQASSDEIVCLDDCVVNETLYGAPFADVKISVSGLPQELINDNDTSITLYDNVEKKTICCSIQDGYFAASGIADGTYSIRSATTGMFCAPIESSICVEGGRITNDIVHVDFVPAGIVKISATDEKTGGAVSSISCQLVNEDGAGATTVLDESGMSFVKLPAGEYNFVQSQEIAIRCVEPVLVVAGEMTDVSIGASVTPFSVIPSMGTCNLTSVFSFGASTNGIRSVEWDFDNDGVYDAKGVVVTNVFVTAGRFDVNMRVTDSNGSSCEYLRKNAVETWEKSEFTLADGTIILDEKSGYDVHSRDADCIVLKLNWQYLPLGLDVGTVVVLPDEILRPLCISNIESIDEVTARVYVKEISIEKAYTTLRTAIPASNTCKTRLDDINYSGSGSVLHFSYDSAGDKGSAAKKFNNELGGSVSVSASIDADVCVIVANGKLQKVSWAWDVNASLELSGRLSVDGRTNKKNVYRKNKATFEVTVFNKNLVIGVVPVNFSAVAYCEAFLEGSISWGTAFRSEYLWTRDAGFNHPTFRPSQDDFYPSFKGAASASVGFRCNGSVGSQVTVNGSKWGASVMEVGLSLGYGAELSLTINEDPEIQDEISFSMGPEVGGSVDLLKVEFGKFWEGSLASWENKLKLEGFAAVNATWRTPKPTFAVDILEWDRNSYQVSVSGTSTTSYDETTTSLTSWDWYWDGAISSRGNSAVYKVLPNDKITHYTILKEQYDFVIPTKWLKWLENYNGFFGMKQGRSDFTIYGGNSDEEEPKLEFHGFEGSISQSFDPNEMAGPLGLGDPNTERFVKPGEWMTYTVYFENMTNATAAAQEVYVANPLSEWLDWSTFEMGEVSFGNQIDLGLSGKSSGTTEKRMDGTNWIVRTELSIEPDTTALDSNRQQKMCAKWYLRIVDPTTSTGWPIDPVAGFLPPNNPDTHCGEGHITYRVKLRDDVPLGTKIENSATIVFDFNEPIKTDPSWWNIVGGVIGDKSLDVTFAMGETELNQDGNYIYDGTAKTPGVSLKVKVGSEIKTLAEGRDFKCTYYDNVNANSEGNYPRISIEAIGNYVGSIVTNFVIAPREVTLTSGSASKVYDGTALVNSTVTVGGDGFVDGEGATFNVAGSQTNVGESENVFSYMLNDGTKASNYTITTANGTLTVTKANVGGGTGGGAVGNEEPGDGEVPQGGVSKFDASCVYDGKGHTIDTNALVAAFGSAIVGASVIEYAIDDGSVSGGVGHAALPWLETAPVYTNAGEYIVWYRVTNQNYEDFTHAAKLTITPRTGVVVDIVGNVATNVYSGAAQSVDGYTVAINDPLYKETDFEFVGNSTVSGTVSGKYPMGLIASQFTNKNMNFAEVTFNVTDGELVILEPPQKNVIFDAIGGTFADGTVVTQECEDVYLAFPAATREGYMFDGWYLGVANGAPKATAGAGLLVDDDHTLFAKWKIDEDLMPGEASIFVWEAIDANRARITGFKDSAQKVSTLLLPDMIEGCFVTEIAAGAFANSKSDMTKLVLPMFCTKIGDKAFTGVTSLSEIVFADVRRWDAPSENGLLTIGRYAFSGAGVEAVTLPKAVGTIGDYAFANCRKLTNLTILGTPTVGVMPLRRAGLDIGGVTVHLDPALANDSTYMETLKQECGNVTVRADAIITRMTLSSLAVSAREIELSVSVEKAASWGKVDLSLVKVAYRESLSEKPIMLAPSSVTENADGSLTVKVVAPKGNSGFFQVVLENK